MKDVFTWTRVWITRVRVNKNQFWLIDLILLNTCLTHVFNSGKHVFNTHVHVNACLTRAFRWTSVWHTRSSERVFHTRVQINACLTRVFRQTRFRQNVHNMFTHNNANKAIDYDHTDFNDNQGARPQTIVRKHIGQTTKAGFDINSPTTFGSGKDWTCFITYYE